MDDLRIKRTKQAIKHALLELVERVGFDKVNVSDIAKLANVNRNTFYLHYDSKEDLVQQIATETIYNEALNSIDLGAPFKIKTKRKIADIFTLILNTVEENAEVYRIFLTNPTMEGYLSMTLNNLKNKAYEYINKTPTIELQLEYLSRGIIGTLSKWVVYATGTKEEVIKVLTDMSYSTGRMIYLNSLLVRK